MAGFFTSGDGTSDMHVRAGRKQLIALHHLGYCFTNQQHRPSPAGAWLVVACLSGSDVAEGGQVTDFTGSLAGS